MSEELEERLRQVAGQAYGEGADAEDVVAALDAVSARFRRLQEVEA